MTFNEDSFFEAMFSAAFPEPRALEYGSNAEATRRGPVGLCAEGGYRILRRRV